jgi:hypothetical protein
MRRGQTADDIRAYAAIRESRLPPLSSPRATPGVKPREAAKAQNGYEVILRGRERVEQTTDARWRRLKALAEAVEIENEALRKELIPTEYVRRWASRFLVGARDHLLRGPSELQDALAAESDPLKCAAILRAWVERVLVKFYESEMWGTDCESRSSKS